MYKNSCITVLVPVLHFKGFRNGLTSFFPMTPTTGIVNLLKGPLQVFITEYLAPVSTKN